MVTFDPRLYTVEAISNSFYQEPGAETLHSEWLHICSKCHCVMVLVMKRIINRSRVFTCLLTTAPPGSISRVDIILMYVLRLGVETIVLFINSMDIFSLPLQLPKQYSVINSCEAHHRVMAN